MRFPKDSGAGDGIRTRNPQLGNLVPWSLSINTLAFFLRFSDCIPYTLCLFLPHLHVFVGHLWDKHYRDQLTSPIRRRMNYYGLVHNKQVASKQLALKCKSCGPTAHVTGHGRRIFQPHARDREAQESVSRSCKSA